MDSEGDTKIKKQGEKINSLQRHLFNVGNVFLTLWVRCFVQANNGYDRILLGRRYYLLYNFRLFLVVLYCFHEINK